MSLRDIIGKVELDHPAYPVQPGKLDAVVDLFTQELGWTELTGDKVAGEWGTARFLRPTGGRNVRIQLTEEVDFLWSKVHPMPVVHLGLAVRHAKTAAEALVAWAKAQGYHPEIEQADAKGYKWFVDIPDLIAFRIEFVSVGNLS